MATARMRRSWVFVLLAVFAVTAWTVTPAEAQDGDAGSLVKDGLQKVRSGKIEEGLSTLRQALAKDPTNKQVMEALNRGEYEALLSMLAQGGDSEKVARELLRRALPILPDKAFDPSDLEEMKRLTTMAVTAKDRDDRFDAGMELGRTYGEYCVPGLVAYLGSSNTDHKVNAFITLWARVGRDAVLPLIEALSTDSASVRRLAASALQNIGDPRALAGLAEAANNESDTGAQKAARAALEAIADRTGMGGGKSVAELYLALATDYYNDVYRVRSFSDRPLALWSFADGKLQYKAVGRHLYMLKMAEEAAYDCLRAEPNNGGARSLLARILASEHIAAVGASKVAEDNELVAAAVKEHANVTRALAALGWDTLSQALNDSLDANDHQVAAAILGVMPKVYSSAQFTADNSVVRATQSSSNAVRFAAAAAVLEFNGFRRITEFPDPAGFMSLVSAAAGEVVPQQVLVIDADDTRRNKVVTALQRAGYIVYDARTGTSGVIRARRFAGLDLIVLASEVPDMEILGVLDRLADDARTQNTPRVMVTNAANAANEEWRKPYEDKVKAIVSVPEGAGLPTESFMNGIKGAFGEQNADVMARYKASEMVLTALAGTDTDNATFDWKSLTATLMKVATAEVPKNVRMAAVSAMGRVGDAGAVATLAKIFSGNDAAMSASAGNAIAAICRQGQVGLDDESFKALLEGTSSKDANVSAAAFSALGSADLTDAQSLKVVQANRPGGGGGGNWDGDGCGCGCGDGCGCGCGCGCG